MHIKIGTEKAWAMVKFTCMYVHTRIIHVVHFLSKQHNIQLLVLVIIQEEEMKRGDSYMYLGCAKFVEILLRSSWDITFTPPCVHDTEGRNVCTTWLITNSVFQAFTSQQHYCDHRHTAKNLCHHHTQTSHCCILACILSGDAEIFTTHKNTR